ncbi:MAG: hypothetical protein Q9M94_06785, partial [Candidatus Gracilibacteria bacterium]|nr:hypothetical protein [Candidatus Gracilibacteria bacterium]
MTQNNIHKKSINNGISAYLMIFLSGLFIFNKKNEFVNNSFVKSHTKIALLIHLSFLIIYLIFIKFSFLKNISVLNYNLNYILASSFFSILFIFLLYGIYKSSKGETFKISEILKIGKMEKIIDINNNGIIGEKDKVTLILSYIPFIGYYIYSEYYKNKLIQKIIKLNLT